MIRLRVNWKQWRKLSMSIVKFDLTWDDTVRNDGNRNNNFPKRVGWFGYWVRQYSSNAHCDFSCNDSIWETSDKPQASATGRETKETINYLFGWKVTKIWHQNIGEICSYFFDFIIVEIINLNDCYFGTNSKGD